MAASDRAPSKISRLAQDYVRYIDDKTSLGAIQSLINDTGNGRDDFASDEHDIKIITAFQDVIKKNGPNKEVLLRFIKEAAQLHNQDNAFLALPPEILLNILGEVPTNQVLQTLGALSRTSTSGLTLFQPELDKLKLKLQSLAHFLVVEPNKDEVRKLIRANPLFLQATIKEVVVADCTITNSTPYQLAHCAGDDDMCKLLKEEMVRLYNGDEVAATNEIRKQVEAKFIGIDEGEDARIKNHLATLLATVIQAINQERFNLGRDAGGKRILNPATLAAIDTFRTEFKKTQPKIIDKGMHFRSNTLQETYETYTQAAILQWRYNYNQCALFEDAVLAPVLSCVPKNDAQRFSQGLYHLLKEQQPEQFARNSTLRGSNINFYDSLGRASSDFSSLAGSCVDIIYGRLVRQTAAWHDDWIARPDRDTLIKTYVEQKQQACKAYTTPNQAYRSGQ